MQSQTQNKVQYVSASSQSLRFIYVSASSQSLQSLRFIYVSASSQSLRFILSLRMNSSFITSRQYLGSNCLHFRLPKSISRQVSRQTMIVMNGRKRVRPTLKILLFPFTRPCFTGIGRSVGIFFNFSNWIPIKLNCI